MGMRNLHKHRIHMVHIYSKKQQQLWQWENKIQRRYEKDALAPFSWQAQVGFNPPPVIKQKSTFFCSTSRTAKQHRSRELWIRTNTSLKMMPKLQQICQVLWLRLRIWVQMGIQEAIIFSWRIRTLLCTQILPSERYKLQYLWNLNDLNTVGAWRSRLQTAS